PEDCHASGPPTPARPVAGLVDIALLLLVVEIATQQAGTGADRSAETGISADRTEGCATGSTHRAAADRARARGLTAARQDHRGNGKGHHWFRRHPTSSSHHLGQGHLAFSARTAP